MTTMVKESMVMNAGAREQKVVGYLPPFVAEEMPMFEGVRRSSRGRPLVMVGLLVAAYIATAALVVMAADVHETVAAVAGGK